jgi:hypothetical protein
MGTRLDRLPAILLGCLSTIALLASCAGDPPTSAQDGVSADRRIQDGSCGYVTNMIVSHDATPGDGIHFRRITDALAAARSGRLARGELRTAACRITIDVAPGIYRASFFGPAGPQVELLPFMVDVPDLTLHGAFVMGLVSGRATGIGVGPGSTTLAPVQPFCCSALIIANGHPDGSAGNGLTVEGFVLQSGFHPELGSTGFAVFSMRVNGLTVRGNQIGQGFDVPLDLRASNAVIAQNSVSGTILCDMCLAGPGVFTVSGNLLLEGALEGIFPIPAVDLGVPADVEPFVLPRVASVTADISNNEVHDHNRRPIGAAIRLGAIGLGADVISSGHYTIRNNLLVHGQFGMLMDASFPGSESKGDLDVAMSGNVMLRNCQANLLVGFARHTTSLKLKEGPYLTRSTYRLTLGGDLAWKDVWFDHPAGFGNRLVVDGQTIPNGHRTFYAPEACPNPLP